MGGPSFVICAQVEQISVRVCKVRDPPIGLTAHVARLCGTQSQNTCPFIIKFLNIAHKIKVNTSWHMFPFLKAQSSRTA